MTACLQFKVEEPNTISKDMKKLPVSKYFSFITGVVETGD
jgi:hypothetical protein